MVFLHVSGTTWSRTDRIVRVNGEAGKPGRLLELLKNLNVGASLELDVVAGP